MLNFLCNKTPFQHIKVDSQLFFQNPLERTTGTHFHSLCQMHKKIKITIEVSIGCPPIFCAHGSWLQISLLISKNPRKWLLQCILEQFEGFWKILKFWKIPLHVKRMYSNEGCATTWDGFCLHPLSYPIWWNTTNWQMCWMTTLY